MKTNTIAAVLVGLFLAIPAFGVGAVGLHDLLGADLGYIRPGNTQKYIDKMELFTELGIKWVRVGLPPEVWWDRHRHSPTPEKADETIKECSLRKFEPFLMLDFQPQFHPDYNFTDFNWREAGFQFA